MSDGFDTLITRANAFFTDLRADNTKAFYEGHKALYNAEIKKPAELLADLMAEDLAKATGKAHKPKVFRIHRDVRFSKDKTPYNTHLHLMWQRPSLGPAWFFGASPEYLILGMGIMGLEKDSLTTYRNMVDRDGDDLTDAMAASGAQLSDWGPAPLKRVPKPFDQDHPHADLLKRKSFALTADLPEGWQDKGLLKTLNRMIPAILPVWKILDHTFPG
ncbi:DUF2461 domain-containing protein [Rhodobacteraceae bacterium N5(2021)]|uniref:DUF2461 domain-containing protein n=1 Tax=Gymnodinialimonas phycosphaerae TaxID=2841589 RepID=A0A975TTW3_9RHOB|nr:DUF2461 domain-containing protein [Gymnodinialimonas phycosphaerae]MBY4894091.1 DUF2461 domain-containing protein [Gymnodinialimonas phycosphaerae]